MIMPSRHHRVDFPGFSQLELQPNSLVSARRAVERLKMETVKLVSIWSFSLSFFFGRNYGRSCLIILIRGIFLCFSLFFFYVRDKRQSFDEFCLLCCLNLHFQILRHRLYYNIVTRFLCGKFKNTKLRRIRKNIRNIRSIINNISH